MTNFLATYLLHSTVLLSAMWLVLRIARQRSPMLVERLWKLAAVLPIVTALATTSWPVPQLSESRASVASSGLIEMPAETLTEPPQPTVVVSDVRPSADESSTAQPVESSRGSDQPSDVPFSDGVGDPLTSLLASDDRRLDTPARPPVEDLAPKRMSSNAHPTSDVPAAEESVVTNVDVLLDVVDERESASLSARAESWWQPVGDVAAMLLPTWAMLGAVWLAIRSMWFHWRLRNAQRVERGRAVELLRELRSHARQSVVNASPLGLVPVVPALLCDSKSTATSVAQKRGNHPDKQGGGLFRHGLATVATAKLRVLIAPGFAEPAAFGLFRPTIALPPSCESLDREALRAVLAHELGHLARGDVWWLTIGRVLTTVLGFQPLNRIARREWTQAAECLCDDWAVGRGVEPLTLARCLTALAEHRLTGVSLADALAAVGSPSSLRTRVERLVAEPTTDPWSKRSRRWLVTGSVVATAIVMAMTLPLPEFVSTPAVADDEDAALRNEIEAELSGLRVELQRATQLAAERDDPAWLEAAEMLRERERRIVEHWQRWGSD